MFGFGKHSWFYKWNIQVLCEVRSFTHPQTGHPDFTTKRRITHQVPPKSQLHFSNGEHTHRHVSPSTTANSGRLLTSPQTPAMAAIISFSVPRIIQILRWVGLFLIIAPLLWLVCLRNHNLCTRCCTNTQPNNNPCGRDKQSKGILGDTKAITNSRISCDCKAVYVFH